MALVRVDFSQSQPTGFSKSVSEIIDRCMNEVLNVPVSENFIVCKAHPTDCLWHAPLICSEKRREQIVFIQITLNLGRSPELKKIFFEKLNQSLVAMTQLQSENIFINLVEVARENWSFGIAHARG